MAMAAYDFQSLSQRLLIRAVHKLNGVTALAEFLKTSEMTLGAWIAGKEVPPASVVLLAVELLMDEPADIWRDPGPLDEVPQRPKTPESDSTCPKSIPAFCLSAKIQKSGSGQPRLRR
jgi:hypothetical protein